MHGALLGPLPSKPKFEAPDDDDGVEASEAVLGETCVFARYPGALFGFASMDNS